MILSGALVAGTRAGLVYPTWPLMGDSFVPPGLYAMNPAWLAAFEDVVTIQFNHRIFAYLLFLVLNLFAFLVYRHAPVGRVRTAAVLLASGALGAGRAGHQHLAAAGAGLAGRGSPGRRGALTDSHALSVPLYGAAKVASGATPAVTCVVRVFRLATGMLAKSRFRAGHCVAGDHFLSSSKRISRRRSCRANGG